MELQERARMLEEIKKVKSCNGQCKRELPETEEFFYFRKDRGKFRNECIHCVLVKRKEHNKRFPLKRILKNIITRCCNPTSENYEWYGGRGIECKIVAEELEILWNRDKAWLLHRPSIDRKDNDEHYTFDNCQFIELVDNIGERNTRMSSKPVLQYDLNGKFIKEWKSVVGATKSVMGKSKSNIANCARGILKSAYGYKWIYKHE